MVLAVSYMSELLEREMRVQEQRVSPMNRQTLHNSTKGTFSRTRIYQKICSDKVVGLKFSGYDLRCEGNAV